MHIKGQTGVVRLHCVCYISRAFSGDLDKEYFCILHFASVDVDSWVCLPIKLRELVAIFERLPLAIRKI